MSMRAVIEGIESEMFERACYVCETNPNCGKIAQCDKKYDISTSADDAKDRRVFTCGREDCEYKKRNCGNCKWWADNEVCVNGDSSYDGYSSDADFCCEFNELKGASS